MALTSLDLESNFFLELNYGFKDLIDVWKDLMLLKLLIVGVEVVGVVKVVSCCCWNDWMVFLSGILLNVEGFYVSK